MGWVTEHHPDPTGLAACVQCGLCLPVCPTFRLTGRETASPRGRLQAMSAVGEGVVGVDEKFAEIIDFCLGCRACEPVCPGLVPYGSLLEGARAEIVAQIPGRGFRGLLVGRLIPSSLVMAMVTFAIRAIRTLHLTGLVPRRFRPALDGIRPLGARAASTSPGTEHEGETVGLLLGCIQNQWFPQVNNAALALLGAAGYRVEIPAGQTCCGALAAHDGHANSADRLMERNLRAFVGCDLVVATAAGCSAHIRDHLEKAVDITVVIANAIEEGRLPVLEASGVDVVVQDPCHLRHAQRIVAEPRAILRAAGFTVVDLDDDGLCCGAAGLYTVLQPTASADLGERKASLVRDTGRRLVASANPGCEMQLRSFLGDEFKIAHPVELYLEAFEQSGSTTIVTDVEKAR